MNLEITYDKNDWRKYLAYISSSLAKNVDSPLKKQWINILVWLYLGFFMVMIFKNLDSIHGPTAIYGLLFILSVYFIFRPNSKKLLEAFAPSADGMFLKKHKFLISDTEIKCFTEGYEGTISWNNIMKVVRAEGMILLFIDTDRAFLFPEDKVDDPDGLYRYLIECNRKYM